MGRLERSKDEDDQRLVGFIRRVEKFKIYPDTGTRGGLKLEHAPIEVTPSMRLWLRLDTELVGALDEMGCFHNPLAIDHMLDEYGIRDFEERIAARGLLREIGAGRALALREGTEGDD